MKSVFRTLFIVLLIMQPVLLKNDKHKRRRHRKGRPFIPVKTDKPVIKEDEVGDINVKKEQAVEATDGQIYETSEEEDEVLTMDTNLKTNEHKFSEKLEKPIDGYKSDKYDDNVKGSQVELTQNENFQTDKPDEEVIIPKEKEIEKTLAEAEKPEKPKELTPHPDKTVNEVTGTKPEPVVMEIPLEDAKEPTQEENEAKGFFEIKDVDEKDSDISNEVQSLFDQAIQKFEMLDLPDLDIFNELKDENQPATARPGIITLGELFTPSSEPYTFESDSEKEKHLYYNLILSGIGKVEMSIFDKNRNRLMFVKQFQIDSVKDGNMIPISAYILHKNIQLSVKLVGTSEEPIKAKLNLQSAFDIDFNGNVKVFCSFIHHIFFNVKNVSKYLTKGMDNRLQFILQSSLKKQRLHGHERIDMYVNKETNFPSKNKYDMKASGTVGSGLIKTISKNNQYYCIEENCEYKVAIDVSGVDFIFFFPTVIPNEMEIKFHNYLYLLEEVEAGETVTYKLLVPKIKGNWNFSVVPTDGSVELYINPDFKPKSLSEYKYLSGGKGAEEIVITHEESIAFNFSYETFYITYISTDHSKNAIFKFEAKRLQLHQRKYIIENVLQSGVVAHDEVINYYMDFANEEPTDYSINVDLTSQAGNADLYVKECLLGEKRCEITNDDLANAKRTNVNMLYRNRIFQFSALEADRTMTKKDNILLTMNCAGRDKRLTQNHFKNDYPVSRSCIFVIGVHCRNSNNKYGAFYNLTVYGQNKTSVMKMEETESVELSANETNNISLALNPYQLQNNKFIVFKMVALTGNCEVYFSWTNKNPNKNDFDGFIFMKNDDDQSIKSQKYTQFLELAKNDGSNDLYISATGKTYCLFDIYAFLVQNYSEAVSNSEKLKLNKLTTRNIDSDSMTKMGNDDVYFASFYLDLPNNISKGEDIKILMNSNILGIELCVQIEKTDFDPKAQCDELSENGMIVLSNELGLTKGKSFAIVVIKRAKKEPVEVFFPIDFTLMAAIDNTNKFEGELILPGKSHSRYLDSGEAALYSVSLLTLNFQALVTLTCDYPTVKAYIFKQGDKAEAPMTVLDSSSFAIRIRKTNGFAERFCGNKACKLLIKLVNEGEKRSHFTLAFTIDDKPFILRQGAQINIPSDTSQYFISEADTNNPLSFNLYSEKTASIIYARVFSKHEYSKRGLYGRFNERKFDFKANLGRENSIIVPTEIMKNKHAFIVSYLYVPKLDVTPPSPAALVLYGSIDKTGVSLHSKITKLRPFKQIGDHIQKGDFKYYYIDVNEPHDIAVLLSVNSGEADLYINRGMYNLTTTKKYWKKSATYKDDEFILTKKMFKKASDITGIYTIGVYAREFSQFSILYAPDRYNIIKLHYQRLIDTKLKKGKDYYFDFYNKHEKFNSILYTQESDIEVSVLNFNEHKSENFTSLINNKSQVLQSFVYKKGSVPRKKMSKSMLDKQSHYVIKMKAIEKDARINFAIYDQQQPLMGFMNKTFNFALDKTDEQIFVVKLDSAYKEVDVEVKLKFGSIEYIINDKQLFNTMPLKMTKTGQQVTKFNVKNIENSNDIVIFKQIFIRIKANEFSSFSLFIKPSNKFKEIKATETELVYTDKENDQYFYFVLEEDKLESIKDFSIELYHINYFGKEPEFLFIADDDIILNSDSPYVPMPLIDRNENKHEDFNHLQLKPAIQKGFYIIKIQKRDERTPVKIRIRINNEAIIEPNGLYSGVVDVMYRSADKYSLYVPEAGEFRFVMESCSGTQINDVSFVSNTKNEKMGFEKNYYQAHQFLDIDTTTTKPKSSLEVAEYNIRRGLVKEPGLVSFNVTATAIETVKRINREKRYYFASEFRPARKELFMYDYVDLFHDNDEMTYLHKSYKFVEKEPVLRVSARIPKFKSQLLVDYPNLHKIKIDFTFYLLADNGFVQQLKLCGMSAINDRMYVKKKITKSFGQKSINKNNNYFSIGFKSDELKKFDDKDYLTVFCSMAISYFENDEDEFRISLDDKYANIPYFVMKIDNEYKRSALGFVLYLLLMALIATVLLIACKSALAKRQENENRKGYEKSGSGVNKLEMTETEINA